MRIPRFLAALLVCCWSAFSAAEGADEAVGGVLRVVGESGEAQSLAILTKTDIKLSVAGDALQAELRQTFTNPLDRPIEAVYAFPLPERAAVNGFEFVVGDRVVVGSIKTRQKAKQVYAEAKATGKVASLVEQERPNLFTQSVANIPAKGTITVTLRFIDALRYEDGTYHLAFPLTIGPKYLSTSMAGTEDAARVTPPYVPSRRSGRELALSVSIDAGVPIQRVHSVSHAVLLSYPSPQTAIVSLASTEEIPNRDFLLAIEVDPASVASGYLAHAPEAGDGFVKLLFVPSALPPAEDVTPKELIFVLDTSGSMAGAPIETSKQVMRYALSRLNPRDTFAVLRYSDSSSALSAAPQANTKANVDAALAFVDALHGEGGTDVLGGARAAFAYPHDTSRVRVVVFLTDGFIGNEDDILREIKDKIGAARLFAVGIGSSVNRYLIRGMGELGRGADVVVTLRDEPAQVAERLFGMIANPYVVGLSLDWGGLAVEEVRPRVLPDLFAGQPLAVYARYTKGGSGTVTLRGTRAGKPVSFSLAVTLPETEPKNEAAATLWARRAIEDLSLRGEHVGAAAVEAEITALALKHRLLSRYTSFVAVEFKETPGKPGEPPLRVEVPSVNPEGVSARLLRRSDSDNDGIEDSADLCPSEPETVNSTTDEDGCPDSPARIVLGVATIRITDQLFFARNKATPSKAGESFFHDLLFEIAKVLSEHPEMTRLRVEGHASPGEKGGAALAKKRAQAVVDALVALGVAPERLFAVGYGSTCPAVQEVSAEDKQRNQRVTFVVLDPSASVEGPCQTGQAP